MQYTKENPLRVVTLCSGYDSQCLALERLKKDFPDFDYELIAWSEFDPETPKTPLEKQPAVIAHNALFPQWKDRNLGDMTKIDWGGNLTLIYSFIQHLVNPFHKPDYNTDSRKVAERDRVLYGMCAMQSKSKDRNSYVLKT